MLAYGAPGSWRTTMDERDTRDGARGEAVQSSPSSSGPSHGRQDPADAPPQDDLGELPPLPPPPPVGADLPPDVVEEQLPDAAFEPPPTPLDGALWPGADPFAGGGAPTDDDDPEVAALMAAFSTPDPAAPSTTPDPP